MAQTRTTFMGEGITRWDGATGRGAGGSGAVRAGVGWDDGQGARHEEGASAGA